MAANKHTYLLSLLCFSLVACGGSNGNDTAGSASEKSAAVVSVGTEMTGPTQPTSPANKVTTQSDNAATEAPEGTSTAPFSTSLMVPRSAFPATGMGGMVSVNGHLYVGSGDRISEVTTDGTVSTYSRGCESDGISAGKPRQADCYWVIQKMAADAAGNLILIDGFSVKRVEPSGKVITLTDYQQRFPAGSSMTSYASPVGLALDDAGNVFVNVYMRLMDNTLERISPEGTITVLDRSVPHSRSIKLDNAGNLYIQSGRSILKRTIDGQVSLYASFNKENIPSDVLFSDMELGPDGRIFVTDSRYGGAYRVDLDGTVQKVAQLTSPQYIARLDANAFIIADEDGLIKLSAR